MTPTQYRDQVSALAKTDVKKAVEIAKKIDDPWFAAQAWSHLARWSDTPLVFAELAAKAASSTKDDYQRSAVRAWEIAALGERGYSTEARKALVEAVELARSIENSGSRAEALRLLFQSAFKLSPDDANVIAEVIRVSCSSGHWREVRSRKLIAQMCSGEMQPREFFW